MKSAILVPTYCGADVLEYFFESVLKYKISPDLFLFVVKPCPNKSRDSLSTIERYIATLKNVYTVTYKGEYGLVRQILLGLSILREFGVEIVIFADDDSYFIKEDFVKKHLSYYFNKKVGGVAGRIINVERDGIKFKPVPIIEEYQEIPPKLLRLWRKPALTLRVDHYEIPHQTYFTKGGFVNRYGNDIYYIRRGFGIVPSLLGGGPNMSIRLSALSDVIDSRRYEDILPNIYIGMRYEQILAYHIVKRGYLIIKDYNIPVFHIYRPSGETRAPRPSRRAVITATDEFIFYYLKRLYPNDFSYRYKLLAELQRFVKHVFFEPRSPGDLKIETLIARLSAQIYGNLLGIWYRLTSNSEYLFIKLKNFENRIKFIDARRPV